MGRRSFFKLKRAGIAAPSRRLRRLTALSDPDINWVSISQGLGVPAVAVKSCKGMIRELSNALADKGPHLIELLLG
jgi:acetolactate synthase-1/2/3 large subunit